MEQDELIGLLCILFLFGILILFELKYLGIV